MPRARLPFSGILSAPFSGSLAASAALLLSACASNDGAETREVAVASLSEACGVAAPPPVSVCWTNPGTSDSTLGLWQAWIQRALVRQLGNRAGVYVDFTGFTACRAGVRYDARVFVQSLQGPVSVVGKPNVTINVGEGWGRAPIEGAALDAFVALLGGVPTGASEDEHVDFASEISRAGVLSLRPRYADPAGPHVSFFASPGLTGASTTIGIGQYAASEMTPPGGALASAQIPAGLGIKVCPPAGAPCLSLGSGAQTFTSPIDPASTVAIVPVVTVLTNGVASSLLPGLHAFTTLPGLPPHRSLVIPPGLAARVCYASGACAWRVGNVGGADGLGIARIEVAATAAGYANPYFGGQAWPLLPGDYVVDPASALASASSLLVSPGAVVTLCTESAPDESIVSAGLGACRRVGGDLGGLPFLGDYLRGNVRWMRVEASPPAPSGTLFTPGTTLPDTCASSTRQRYVADLFGGACLDPFQSAASVDRWVASSIAPGAPVCVYEWQSASGVPADLSLLDNSGATGLRPFCEDDVDCDGTECSPGSGGTAAPGQGTGGAGSHPCDVCSVTFRGQTATVVVDPRFTSGTLTLAASPTGPFVHVSNPDKQMFSVTLPAGTTLTGSGSVY